MSIIRNFWVTRNYLCHPRGYFLHPRVRTTCACYEYNVLRLQQQNQPTSSECTVSYAPEELHLADTTYALSACIYGDGGHFVKL